MTTYSVGGTVSGLSGTVVLQDNGGDDLSVTASGPFTFATKLATRAGLQRDGQDQPVRADLHGGQRVRARSARRTSPTSRSPARERGATYTVGGTVSGLSGTVVLQDNGGDDLSVTRQRRVHLRDHAGLGRGLQRDGQDQPVRADLHGGQRVRHDRVGERHQRRGHLHQCGGHVLGRRDGLRAVRARWCCRTTAVMT